MVLIQLAESTGSFTCSHANVLCSQAGTRPCHAALVMSVSAELALQGGLGPLAEGTKLSRKHWLGWLSVMCRCREWLEPKTHCMGGRKPSLTLPSCYFYNQFLLLQQLSKSQKKKF